MSRGGPTTSYLTDPPFFPHLAEWTSYNAPDPTGAQYAVMCAAIKQIAVEKARGNPALSARAPRPTPADQPTASASETSEQAVEGLLEHILVWVDYCSGAPLLPSGTEHPCRDPVRPRISQRTSRLHRIACWWSWIVWFCDQSMLRPPLPQCPSFHGIRCSSPSNPSLATPRSPPSLSSSRRM